MGLAVSITTKYNDKTEKDKCITMTHPASNIGFNKRNTVGDNSGLPYRIILNEKKFLDIHSNLTIVDEPTNNGPLVETLNGLIEGIYVYSNGRIKSNAFIGIPFALPPIGELRFKKPVKLEGKWNGVLLAKKYGDRSIQRDFFWDIFAQYKVRQSEDCLYLNIITPPKPKQEFPNGFAVMVYIHGGGFVMDSAARYHYKNISKTLVCRDVIVVTLQYRLGYLGFLCTNDENAVGNYGIWDQILALKWIRKNIAKFGGNPENITVFGQSAGAVSTDILCLSPISKDLFNQAILMGGNAETIWAISSKEDLAAYCQQKALNLGFQRINSTDEWSVEENGRMVEYLRGLPAEKFEFTETTMIGDRSIIGELRIPITPVIDGKILPKSINELRKEAKPRRIIAGTCEFEGLLFFALGFQRANSKFLSFCEERAKQLIKEANLVLPYDSKKVTFDEFLDHYGISKTNNYNERRHIKKVCVDIMGDLVNNFALENYCKKSIENGSTVWRYEFKHFNSDATFFLNPILPFRGATHCSELVYLFDINVFVAPFSRTNNDYKVMELTTRLWTNFAKFADPNIDNITEFIEANQYTVNDSETEENECSSHISTEEESILENFQSNNTSAKDDKINLFWPTIDVEQPQRHLIIDVEPMVFEKFASKRIGALASLIDCGSKKWCRSTD